MHRDIHGNLAGVEVCESLKVRMQQNLEMETRHWAIPVWAQCHY
jgi:hypothetical protein